MISYERLNSMARPSNYNKDFHPQSLITIMATGALDCEIFAEWDISKATFYRWLNDHEELKEAHEMGLQKCEAWWTKRMRESFLDKDDKGFKYCIAIMNNKFGWEKGSKQQDAGSTTNINIGNMNLLQDKSRDGLLQYINERLTKNGDLLFPKPVAQVTQTIDVKANKVFEDDGYEHITTAGIRPDESHR